jgi:hypothetical protein
MLLFYGDIHLCIGRDLTGGFPGFFGMPHGGVPELCRGIPEQPKQEGGAIVSYQYFADSSLCLQIGLFNSFGHYFKYIKEVNVCPLLIEVSTTLVASEPAPCIPALK